MRGKPDELEVRETEEFLSGEGMGVFGNGSSA